MLRKIQQRGSDIRIIHEFDDSTPPIAAEEIARLKWDLRLEDFEFSRTHWAVKEGDLYSILREGGIIQPTIEAERQASQGAEGAAEQRPATVEVRPTKVFLVHGRDEGAKHSVARFLEKRVGVEVVILSERPNRGRGILTKFEEEADGASYAIVLMTADDVGHLQPKFQNKEDHVGEPRPRPRQNVVFELGFFLGRLGTDRVCALIPPGVEKPSDYDGIVYIPFDEGEGWQKKLVTELHAADVPVSSTWWQA